MWGDVIRQIGQILYEQRVIPTSTANSVTLRMEPGLRWGPIFILLQVSDTMWLYCRNTATNSRSVADRGFALGWRPKSKSVEETLEEDVTETLKRIQN